MNWWTSIAFYLCRNSFRRWIEQPLGFLSKWAISALIGILGAVMIAGTSFLGDEIGRQLASREAMTVTMLEVVPAKQASALLAPDDPEEGEWEKLAEDSLTLYQVPAVAKIDEIRDVSIVAMRDPERYGYPDAVVLITRRQPEGATVVARIDTLRVEALAMPPKGALLEKFVANGEMIMGSVNRLSPLMQNGFTRQVLFQAKSIEAIEQAQEVNDTLQAIEHRRVSIRSVLPLLLKLREIREIQRYVLLAVTVGSALVLGLICGALAWMEFREERYLLALIRSFGVGRVALWVHAVVENCLIAVTGVLLGLAGLAATVSQLNLRALKLDWLTTQLLFGGGTVWVLVLGGLFGGLLSSLPVGIGLRKPLGLLLK